jgi:hypothetical protein
LYVYAVNQNGGFFIQSHIFRYNALSSSVREKSWGVHTVVTRIGMPFNMAEPEIMASAKMAAFVREL